MRFSTYGKSMLCTAALALGTPLAADFSVASPDGKIAATVTHDEGAGTLSYVVQSGGVQVIAASALGITTDKGDFTSGFAVAGNSKVLVDETYRLPAGKRSTYHNHANELVLRLSKGGQEISLRFRAYDDGIAYSYAIGGTGPVSISGEASAIVLAGGNHSFWGQDHPNNYGYESMLGPITSNRMSTPVMARLGERNHYILLAQASSFGNYILSNFQRAGGSFKFAFPMDQTEPVKTTLPFQSPWRIAIISPENPGKIVESSMFENCNPPTEPELVNADWIKAGRSLWDFIAGDNKNYKGWMDAASTLGFEYYLADAGFTGRFNPADAVAYGKTKNVGLIGWHGARSFWPHETNGVTQMKRYGDWGLRGAKIDFFDQNWMTGVAATNDFEDTQFNLAHREWLMQEAIKHKMMLEFHGATIPTGERRRFPHYMNSEAVAGMEKRTPTLTNDLTIAYVRNIMGSMSYTIIRFAKSPGTRAYDLATSIVFEAGIQIYAELHSTLLAWAGSEMLKKVPANWDDIHFIDGAPASHIITARRKNYDWFVGGMTSTARTANVTLDFLLPNVSYNALIFRDGDKTTMTRETKTVTNTTVLQIPMIAGGGFAIHLGHPNPPIAINPEGSKAADYFQGRQGLYRITARNGALNIVPGAEIFDLKGMRVRQGAAGNYVLRVGPAR